MMKTISICLIDGASAVPLMPLQMDAVILIKHIIFFEQDRQNIKIEQLFVYCTSKRIRNGLG